MDLELEGKGAVITGGSRGIGKAIAHALAAEGARVAIIARGASDLEQAAAEIAGSGGQVSAVRADLASEAGAQEAFEQAVRALGGVDIVVNNAGGSLGTTTFDQVDSTAWGRVLELNLMSAVHMSRAAVEHMRARGGGVIIHVGSTCGREYCTSAPYLAAKAALAGLTKEMGVDLARLGIRVVNVSPGSILFPGGSWDRRHREKPELIAKMLREDLPWGRFGAPEEVASVVVFAASKRASWVTGSTIVVDGGQGRAL